MTTDKKLLPAGSMAGLGADLWAGLAAMLVALPSAIAFGVSIFSPLGSSYAAQGALAGILGATAIGLFAAAFGGTKRLISAPCAPAAAVLSAMAIELSQRGTAPGQIVLGLALVGLTAGALQVLFGLLRLGQMIKYMPYPVVSGYLSGVGLLIILSQVPKVLGAPKDMDVWAALAAPGAWNWQAMSIGLATVLVMVLAPRATKLIPAVILGLAAGILTYFLLALFDTSLLVLTGNALVVGPLGDASVGFFDGMRSLGRSLTQDGLPPLAQLLVPALTLAVLLSIDTLKTCLIVDSLTHNRHNSNRELVAQGLGNIASNVLGGIPGAGTMGATLVNISSGAQTRRSSLAEGALSLVAFLLLGSLVAWVPVAALAAILIVIGVRMFDRNSLQLLRSRSTVLDFAVIVVVVLVAETVSLIAASAAGVGLAIILFIREQMRGSSVRRLTHGTQMFSKQIRLPEQRALLEANGGRTAIIELQGSLFFGTTDELYTVLEPQITARTYIILDMRRVSSVDVTAAHMIGQIEDRMAERDAFLIFSGLPRNVVSGMDMQRYFDEAGLVRPEQNAHVFDELDDALQWVEDRIIAEASMMPQRETPLELREIALFSGRKDKTLAALEQRMSQRSLKNGERAFSRGETGDELFLIRSGAVRIELILEHGQRHHVSTFGRGDFFGEMAFLDRQPRSADAVAEGDTALFVLSRHEFDALVLEHRMLVINLLEGLAKALADRLRQANTELRVLQDS